MHFLNEAYAILQALLSGIWSFEELYRFKLFDMISGGGKPN